MLSLILAISLALQLAVVYFALRLIRITGKHLAWGLIAAAVTLMALRRIISLIDTAFSDTAQQADLAVEILALVISALMALGLKHLTHLVADFRAASTNLKESETRYRMIFENSPISIWEEDFSAVKHLFDRLRREGVSDLDAHFARYPELAQECAHLVKIVDVNRATLALHGADSKETLLAGLADTFTPESFQTFREELVCLWRGETEVSRDALVKTLAGEPRQVAVTFAVCPGYEATLAKIFVSLVDVTARKQAEQERQRHVDILAKMDRIHRAIQKSDDLDAMMRNVLDEVLAIFGCDRVYLLYPCDPGAASWRVPMERHKPEYPGAGSLGVDIPMSAEIAAKLRLLLGTDDALTFGPGNAHPLPAEIAARFGFKSMMAAAVYPKLGHPWEFGLHQCDHERTWTQEEARLLQKIGWRLSDALTSFLAFENLRQSEEKYRQIVDTALEGVWLLDAEGRTTFVNTRVTEIMGYAKDELLGRLASDFMFEEDVAEHRQKIKNRSRHIAESYERRMRRKNGETLWTIISASPIVTDNGGFGGSCAMLTDITARKQAELQLKQTLDFTEGVINAIPDILLEMNAEGRYLNIWARNPELLAAPKEALIGRTVHEVLPPEAAEAAINGIREANEKELVFGKMMRLDLPHGTYWFEHSLSKIATRDPSGEARFLVMSRDVTERKRAEEKIKASEARFRAIFRDAALGIALVGPDRRIIQANPALERLLGFAGGQLEGKAFENLFDVPERDKLAQCLARLDSNRQRVLDNDCHLLGEAGRELVAHVMLSSIQDDDGQAALTLALVDDLTERRAAAAREAELQARLAHLGRIGLMGELTATLAHELNNPLGIIANYAAGCAKRIASGAPPASLLPALEKIGRQARLAGDIIQHTRSFVSKGEPVQGTAMLAEAIEQSLEFIEAHARQANAEIERQLASGLPPLAIPLVQLQQIFLNLLMNAIDAVQEQNQAPRRIWLRAVPNDAGMVEITVADNGPLLEIPPQLFDAFYTTKPSGLGMGLPICHTLVEKHGGRIWATLEGAHGLAVHFTLPAANGHAT